MALTELSSVYTASVFSPGTLLTKKEEENFFMHISQLSCVY